MKSKEVTMPRCDESGVLLVNTGSSGGGSASAGLEYNATPPTLADEGTATLQGDVNANLKVIQAAIPQAYDNDNGKIVVEERYDESTGVTNITSATTTTLFSTGGFFKGLMFNNAGAGTGGVTIYLNSAASGTKLATIGTTVTDGTFFGFNVECDAITIVSNGADLTALYRPNA